jgi:hypothetical protein
MIAAICARASGLRTEGAGGMNKPATEEGGREARQASNGGPPGARRRMSGEAPAAQAPGVQAEGARAETMRWAAVTARRTPVGGLPCEQR